MIYMKKSLIIVGIFIFLMCQSVLLANHSIVRFKTPQYTKWSEPVKIYSLPPGDCYYHVVPPGWTEDIIPPHDMYVWDIIVYVYQRNFSWWQAFRAGLVDYYAFDPAANSTTVELEGGYEYWLKGYDSLEVKLCEHKSRRMSDLRIRR